MMLLHLPLTLSFDANYRRLPGRDSHLVQVASVVYGRACERLCAVVRRCCCTSCCLRTRHLRVEATRSNSPPATPALYWRWPLHPEAKFMGIRGQGIPAGWPAGTGLYGCPWSPRTERGDRHSVSRPRRLVTQAARMAVDTGLTGRNLCRPDSIALLTCPFCLRGWCGDGWLTGCCSRPFVC